MSHSVKRAKSKNEQFRMAVPADIRHVVGKTEWTETLGTTDPLVAAEKRALLVAEHKGLIRQIRENQERNKAAAALSHLECAFQRLAEIRGSMDGAVAHQLNLLGSIVIDSWQAPATSGQLQHWGDFLAVEPEPQPEHEPISSIDNEAERSVFKLRADIIEGRGIADGFVYRDLAALLLERRVFRPIWFAVSYMSSIEPKLRLDQDDDLYDSVAEAYLRQLAEHVFTAWPSDIYLAVGNAPANQVADPVLTSSAHAAPLPAPLSAAVAGTIHHGLLAMPLSQALTYWKEQRLPRPSAVNEASRAVARFIHFFGDLAVGDITRDHVLEFRNLVADLPPQTELAKVLEAGTTLRALINEARERRSMWEEGGRIGAKPARLAPGSVKKDIGAISAIIGKIQSDLGNEGNVATKLEIAGYSKTRAGQARPHLPFPPALMQKLFDSPLFTGCAGEKDAARRKPGPYIFQDELYWAFLFGVVSGPRLGEIGQLALSDVHEIDLKRTFGPEYEGKCTYINITGTGDDQHVKTESSERFVVIHDKLIAIGFTDYVERRRAQGRKRLFDLEPDSDGNFVKELSRRLNRYIDGAVTDDKRYVFHSTRHEFTDRADLSLMPTRVANSIKGHANMTEGEKYGLVSILQQYVHLKNLKVGFIDWDRLIAAVNRSRLCQGERVQVHIVID